jgi:uncharacterized protein (TIGR03066 family)
MRYARYPVSRLAGRSPLSKGTILRRNRLIFFVAVVVAIAAVLGLTGCKAAQSKLVGTWTVSMGSAAPSGKGLTWEFTQDGKFNQAGGSHDVPGTYKESGNTVTMTTTVNGTAQSSTIAIKWVSADKFIGTIAGMSDTPLTFTRKK